MKTKKGLSNIIATFSILLITIACIVIVATVIKNTSQNILDSPEFNCLNFNIEPPVKTTQACYNPETNKLSVKLEKSIQQDININSLEFIINTVDSTENFICSDSCGNCEVLKQGSKTYYFDFEDPPTQVALKINNCILQPKEIKKC